MTSFSFKRVVFQDLFVSLSSCYASVSNYFFHHRFSNITREYSLHFFMILAVLQQEVKLLFQFNRYSSTNEYTTLTVSLGMY